MQESSCTKVRAHRSPKSSIGSKTGSPDTKDQNRSRSLLKTKCRGLRPENFCTEFSEVGTRITKRAAPKGTRHDGAGQIKRGAVGRHPGKSRQRSVSGCRSDRVRVVYGGEN